MLTQLELFGFKSFADRTAFDFVQGITCVVGPNGSGKSNVVDAIKWILGDQSAKSLRGKEMSDVIFNGSASRKPSGYAEATLTFDNRSRLLQVDADDVRVGRRLYRSGESEYLLNGAVVRLKDVKDALLGTGAGTSAYSIIEQGRVDQILQANPTTRRVVFEEAAGISRFKNRRVDAERKLERVAQNLARLKDIVDEVETQLNATRNQASKAARYRELSTELRELWTGLAADEYRRYSADLATATQRAGDHERQSAELAEQIAALESARSEIEGALTSVDDRLQGVQREASGTREAIAAGESTIRHQTGRHRELDLDIADLRRERQQLSQRARSVVTELSDTAERISRFEATLAEHETALAARDAVVGELEGQAALAREHLASRRGERDQIAAERNEQGNRIALLTSQRAAAEETLASAAEACAQLAESVAAATAARNAAQEIASVEERAHAELLADVDRLQGERVRLLDEQGHSEKSLAAMREQRVAWDARIHVLENLEQRQEGLGIGVREILKRASTIDGAPWNSIVGCVGDLLQVPLDHAALVEVALGGRAQLIVTRDLAALSDYINSGAGLIQGRVGFLAAPANDAQRANVGASPDLAQEPGVIARADWLADEPPELKGLAAALLSGTWVVESLADAHRLAPHHAGLRWVTLQGELLDADGVLYAGTVPHEISVVSRKSELRRLRADLQQLDEEIAEQFAELTSLGRNLTDVDGTLADAELRLRQAGERLSASRSNLTSEERELKRLLNAREHAETEQTQLRERHGQLAAELAETEVRREELRVELEDHHVAITATEAELREIEQSLDQVREEHKRQQLELATHAERAAGLRDVQSRLERDQQQQEEQLRQAGQRLSTLLGTRRDIELQVLNTQARIAELCGQAEREDAERLQLEEDRAALRTQRAALHREEDALHRRRRSIADALHECELQVRECTHQRDALALRIEEEFQVRLSDLAESGVSALERFSHTAIDPDATSDAELEDGDAGTAPAHPGAVAEMPDADTLRAQLEEEVQKLRRKIKALGNVNTDALANLDELETRYTRLSTQFLDLSEAKTALEEIIRRINAESRRMFVETFETIREHFRELFRRLFGGGEADIVLEDPNDVLDCGIDILARPPGKELRNLSLLSGGEKTLTAVALLFAMFKSKPSPYCILDEVDAALDEANVERYATILNDFTEMTQFVVITHRKRTMTVADAVYGVTMEQAGVSKRMSVRFEDVSENGEIRTRAA